MPTPWKLEIDRRREHLGPFRWWLKSDPNFNRLRESGSLERYLDPEKAE